MSEIYICDNCGYVYDAANGDTAASITPGTAFHALSEEWTCPYCGGAKESFSREYQGSAYFFSR